MEQVEFPFADLGLARRLERVEGLSNARLVEARAALEPEAGASWEEIAGAIALFDGPDSFCTQAFGLGLSGSPSDDDLDRLEQFFHSRGAAVQVEICPMAGAELPGRLGERGYRVVETSSVLYRPIRGFAESPVAGVGVRAIGESERDLWIDVAAEGWSETEGAEEFIRAAGPVMTTRREVVLFVAEIEGRPVAAAGLGLHEGTALLAGAATIPSARNRGAQRALLEARLAYGAAQGCDLAMLVTEPGSASQRNGERNGFRIAYSRTKWKLGTPDVG